MKKNDCPGTAMPGHLIIKYLLLMKLSIVILFATSFQAFSINSNSQSRITLEVKNTSISAILNKIQSRYEYRFFYTDELGLNNKKIDLLAKNATIDYVMEQLLSVTGYSYKKMSNGLVVIIGQPTGIAALQVKGTVVDENGNPLAGVSVIEKSTANGTSTAEDGSFSLNVSDENAVLIASTVGYLPQEVTVKDQKDIRIVLKKDDNKLDEVIVVGYGTQKKVNLTGAVSQVGAEALENRPVANISQALQGAIPNVNINFNTGRPGAEGSFNIRGNTSINGGGAPLILIDGVPGNLNSINPRDVENISVLKDAASAAIYGARGSFGVILVTTKKAKRGKMTVNYSNNFGWAGLTTRTDFITDGYTSAKLNDEAFLRATGNTYTRYTEEDYEELKKRQTDKSLPSVVITNRSGKDQYMYYGNTDWWHTMFRDWQPSREHSLSITGGSEKIDFLISGRIYGKDGMMQINQDNYTSYNFRAKITARLSDKLELFTNTYFNTGKYTYPGWGWNSNFVSITVHALPSYVPVNPDGTATYSSGLNSYSIGDGIFADLLHGKSKGDEKRLELINLVGATFKPIKGMEITGNYSYTFNPYSTMQRRTKAPWSINPGVISYVGNDYLAEEVNLIQYQAVNVFGSYAKKAGLHNFKIMAGYNQELRTFKQIKARNTDLLSEDLNDFRLATGQATLDGQAEEWALQGYFSRLNYDFNGKYLLEFNGRYDGSSRFPKGQRFGFFPSVSGGWRVSEEPFWSSLKGAISEFKLRSSYGSLGNQQEAAVYGYIPTLRRGTMDYIFNGTRGQSLAVPVPILQSLTWERSKSVDVGVDIGILKNRLNITYDWYVRNTLDMLIPGKTLPAVYGEASPKTNAGDMQTRGWELLLAWSDHASVAGKPFNYNVSVGVGDYKAKITRFDNPQNLLSNYYVGQELGEIWGYKIGGFFKTDEEATEYQKTVNQDFVNKQRLGAPGNWSKLMAGDMKFIDVNGDGVVNNGKNTLEDHGDLVKIGNKQPRYTFGINLGADWNGFDLSVFLQGIGKQQWYPGANADKFWGPYSRPYYSFLPVDFEEKIWNEENPNAYFPKLRGYEALNAGGSLNAPNDRYLQDLAYIRLKNLSIGYSLPESWLSKVKISRCRIYLSGDNIFTATKLKTKYIDPEMAAAEANGRIYPISKIYSFGLDLSF
ncbi:SusC/RagA family TonB-linked outer membrane protein [Niabella sp. 3A5MI-3]|nr:SusC/RagA family TonB-linked outer membrane protein [Niabella beijingensis]